VSINLESPRNEIDFPRSDGAKSIFDRKVICAFMAGNLESKITRPTKSRKGQKEG